ncbi:MAG: AAA family ATPase, partial [Deltaproteobacteria bacterium]|nr:AAA family ATPase [Deltaproteobacteria bacterium]
MKIDILRLQAFGPFTNKVVDFSGEGHGLHIVFGPNEAGKSTALRAMLGLLYGFGQKVEDAWLHDYKKLEVGGSLRLSDGRLLNMTRYKRRKNDLIDDTGEPMGQLELDAILGKMDRQAFEHAFGISHQSLRQGVESVLAAGGELGHALFAATSGLNVLKQVMAGLEEKQNSLFRPRAQKAVINADIAELEHLNKELRAASASQHQWKKMKRRLDDLCDREARAADRLEAMSSEVSLLSRHRDALKYVTRRDELQKALATLGPVPDLAEDFAQRRVEIQVKMKTAEQAEQNLFLELADIDQQLETLTYDNQVIAHAKLIEELAKQVSVHTTALADMKKLRGEIYRHNESAQRNISLLRAGLTLEGIEALRLSTADKSKIQRLGNRYAKLEEAFNHAERVLQTAKADLSGAREDLDGLETPKDTSSLEDCLEHANGLGKIEDQLSHAQLEYASALEQAEADLSALGLWSGELGALEKLAIPSPETMRGFESSFSKLDQGIEELKKEGTRLDEELKEKQKALSDLTESRDLASLEDLQSHRDLRERGWRSVRSVWLEQGEVDQGFMDAMSYGNDLAGAYEKAVSIADDTADILRNDAEDVARAQALKSGIQDLGDKVSANKKRQEMEEKSRAAYRDEWKKLWQPLGIAPLEPREMAAWSARAEEIRRRAAECRKKKNMAEQLKADMERMAGELSARLKELNVPLPDKLDYAELLDLAKRTRRKNDRLIKDRQSRESEIAGYERQINDSIRRKDETEGDMKARAMQWTQAVGKLGFSADATPEDVNDFVLALDQVFAELEKADGKRQRIAGMQSNYEKYAARVKDLLDKLAPDLGAADPTVAIVELHDRLASDQTRFKDRKLFEEQRKKKHADLLKIRENLAAESEKLRLLCEEAQTNA